MTIKVFISYSHKDEKYKDSLEEHLTPLKRSGVIDTWNDRKITAGDEWRSEISENLETSSVIIFLVSPSFLASEYCYEVEARRAIEMQESGKACLISIVVRPCDWGASNFAKFQVLPKDGKAVAIWESEDSAWLDVVKQIKKSLIKFEAGQQLTIPELDKMTPCVMPLMLKWIDDTEVIFTHRTTDKVRLKDIYVLPDIERQDEKLSMDSKIVSSANVLKTFGRHLISGDEQIGKTSFLKYAYKKLLEDGQLPLYLQSKDIKKSALNDLVKSAVSKQYSGLSLDQFKSSDKKVLLLDDLSEINLNSRFRGVFLNSINELFANVIITTNSSFSYIAPDIPELDNYEYSELLSFGHDKRAELIEKWVSLGIEESIKESELYSQCDELKARLDAIVRKNIVPSKPLYLLIMLQMFEAYAKQNLELTSYGHCYQELIYQAFKNAGITSAEVNKYMNVLTELAWDIHKKNEGLNQNSLDNFFDNYQKVYLGVDRQQVVDKLYKNSILIEINNKINFKYPYLFYFFTAKKIAESFLKDDGVKAEIRNLLKNLHREDYANILVFVTHHTKDEWILEEIQKTLHSLFEDQVPAKLNKNQLGFMDEFIIGIPNLIIEQREIRSERKEHNKKLDTYDSEPEDDFSGSIDILAKINMTFKGMDIAGQIIRNRHASLTRNSLLSLAQEGAGTGLRFLSFFIGITDIAKSEVIKHIEKKLREHPNLTDKEIHDYAEGTFLHLTYNVINGVIRKIASSIGSKEAGEIYKKLEEMESSPAIVLLNQAINLQFKKILSIEDVENTEQKLRGNPVCQRILREIVIQHTYMFPVGYKEKQQLSDILGLSVQGQRVLDFKKIAKG